MGFPIFNKNNYICRSDLCDTFYCPEQDYVEMGEGYKMMQRLMIRLNNGEYFTFAFNKEKLINYKLNNIVYTIEKGKLNKLVNIQFYTDKHYESNNR